MSGKTLVNAPSDAVHDAIRGLLLTRPDLVAVASASVVARAALPRNRVAVISGGGAGHEPAHAGLVADGLLTAAVSGGVFASPTVSQILTAVRLCGAAAGPSTGVLLIVKSYTGDRLAFGLAAETAKAEGYAVETVYVADDAAVDAGHVAGRRGIAGTVLVHKVAGALAQAGAPLAIVAAGARHAASIVVSMGASLTTCSVPGVPAPSSRLGPGCEAQVEVGLGIHGEPGRRSTAHVPTADELAEELVRACVTRLGEVGRTLGAPPSLCPALLPAGVEGAGGEEPPPLLHLAVLVNNLGGLSQLEQAVFTGAVCAAVEGLACTPRLVVARLYTGSLMTALDMKGASVSLLPVRTQSWSGGHNGDPGLTIGQSLLLPDTNWKSATSTGKAWAAAGGLGDRGGGWAVDGSEGDLWRTMDVLDCLDAHTTCPHWPSTAQSPPRATYVEAPAAPPPVQTVGGPASHSTPLPSSAVAGAVSAAAAALSACAGEVTRLDTLAGDGDAGATFARMGQVAAAAVDALTSSAGPTVSLDAVLSCIGVAIAQDCGGTSGVLYALMFTAAGRAAVSSGAQGGAPPAALPSLAACLRVGVETTSSYGGARAGDRTFLDVLLPVTAVLERAVAEGGQPSAAEVVEAAEGGVVATAGMTPAAGRAAYVNAESVVGTPDAGAVASAAWIKAVVTAALQQG